MNRIQSKANLRLKNFSFSPQYFGAIRPGHEEDRPTVQTRADNKRFEENVKEGVSKPLFIRARLYSILLVSRTYSAEILRRKRKIFKPQIGFRLYSVH